MGFNFFWGGDVALFRVQPLGGSLPHMTIAYCGPKDPTKIVFVWRIAPYLGEKWGLADLHFGLLFLKFC